MTIQISIIGLGKIGSSVGLALSAHTDQVTRLGNDIQPKVMQAALKMGAVDRLEFNLPACIEKADIILLALPADQIYNTLRIIAQDVRADAVIMDTSPGKTATAKWVSELLPPGRHYVGLTPTLNPLYFEEHGKGIDASHADLFKSGLTGIAAPHGTPSEAVKLAADLITLLGSQPYFVDLSEIDGLISAAHLLPQLAAVALVETTVHQSGWSDIRKVTGDAYASAVRPAHHDEPAALATAVKNNSGNMLRLLDDLIDRLVALREEVAEDIPGLESSLEAAKQAHDQWHAERTKGEWHEAGGEKPELPTMGDLMRQQLLGSRKKK